MKIEVTGLEGLGDVKLLRYKRFADERGFFAETWTRRDFDQAGIGVDFVQDNHSYSRFKGTVRGLHFQTELYAQAKLVRVTQGRILDVAVDLRHGSPTFGRHAAAILDADEPSQLFVPIGFAHGFVTLADDTHAFYKTSSYYSPEHDKGLLWNDPALAIPWGFSASEATLSDKDLKHPTLADLPTYFSYSARTDTQ